ncbi:GATA zinc finger domain-containing protein 14-like [Papilio machaon]|uniref:GATA zinc finger domain-containing protein 14-like n=1 Tax=Papilio machaon TaxID=76193 RepID=UPI001E663268|nr:GATA zinc finger domain-containing protein 14-like [Papilio machaon]
MIKMTDSEDDLLENYQYSFQNVGMAIRAKGPNIDFESFSLPSSTMQMLPGNVNRPKYGHMNNGQRSLYYRRETSPMSAYNVSHFSRPYNRSFSARSHTGSLQSVYNRGNRSPASVRSIDSNATVTASDIVVALKNEHFNKYDQKLLKAACYKFLKNKSRKRLEYMRNRRILMNKIRRRHSTEDLGELASESSSSSENSVSPKIFKPKDSNGKIIKNNVNQDCMENNYTNILDVNQKQNVNGEETSVIATVSKQCTYTSKENCFLLKDQFKKRFLLPQQRFSNSNNGPSSETNISCNSNKNQVPKLIRQCPRELNENNSDEEIFSVPINDRLSGKSQTTTRKRTIDSNYKEDNPKAPKQMKIDTPKKTDSLNCVNNIKNDFNFAKPQMPVTKFVKLKKKKAQPEILISKSSQPLSVINETVLNTLSPIQIQPIQESTRQDINNTDKRSSINNESVNTTNDVSKRPSFVKRKLFTQKLDVIEAKIDTPQSSPSVDKYVGNKEKTKPRKLASSQSCLSRDVAEDNNNLLNLLHKIVPVEQMSLINSTTNKPDTGNRKSEGDCAKWDIDSVLSTCNADDGSDTYTDEEILANGKNENGKSNEIAQTNVVSKEVEEIPPKNKILRKTVGIKDGNENTTKTNQKSFCDTDIESDWESNVFLPSKLNNCQRSKAAGNQRVDKVIKNKSAAVNSLAKNINANCLNVDAIKKTANNCQPSIWDTDFESDLESFVILPKKTGNCKTNNATINKNHNDKENCGSNKNVQVNSKTKKNNSKSVNIDVNKTVANNYQKSIWDTDFESDLESCGILPQAKKANKINATNTANRKVNTEENCDNKNGAVNSKTKNVIKPMSQKVNANKKTARNQPKSIWDTDFESDMDLSNKSGICKTDATAINQSKFIFCGTLLVIYAL